jgi:hypothetical protein
MSASLQASTPDTAAAAVTGNAKRPKLTQPQLLAFFAFLVFVGMAILASDTGRVRPDELTEIRKFSLFLIAALLPSDAVIRFGRNLLFQTVDDPDKNASDAPATTLAQWLAFLAFVVLAALTLLSNKLVTADEFSQVNDVARLLVIALLPSDAGIRFGRAIFYRAAPAQLTADKLKLI